MSSEFRVRSKRKNFRFDSSLAFCLRTPCLRVAASAKAGELITPNYWEALDIPRKDDPKGEIDLLLSCNGHNFCKETDNLSKPGNNNNPCDWDVILHRPVLSRWNRNRDTSCIDSRTQRSIGPEPQRRPHRNGSPYLKK
jgi:hypothetical protein